MDKKKFKANQKKFWKNEGQILAAKVRLAPKIAMIGSLGMKNVEVGGTIAKAGSLLANRAGKAILANTAVQWVIGGGVKAGVVSSITTKAKAGTLLPKLKQDIKDLVKIAPMGPIKRIQALGGMAKALVNDRSWYESRGPIDYAANTKRPMNPSYTAPFTNDPSKGSVVKLIDYNLVWSSLTNNEAFDLVALELYKALRDEMKSNIVYDVDDIKMLLRDAIACDIYATQLYRHIRYCRCTDQEFPKFMELWNRDYDGFSTYGPAKLTPGDEGNLYLDKDNLSATIALVDKLSVVTQSMPIPVPKNLHQFITFYFGTLFMDQGDRANAQYIVAKLRNMETGLFNEDLSSSTHAIGIPDPEVLLYMWQRFRSVDRYAVILADMYKLLNRDSAYGLDMVYISMADWKTISASNLSDAAYSPDFLNALSNAYTSNTAVDNGFVRLDFNQKAKDELTTFVLNGAIAPQPGGDDPLACPLPVMQSMALKIANASTLDWEREFDQGNTFDWSTPYFALLLNSDVYVDAIATAVSDQETGSIVFNANPNLFGFTTIPTQGLDENVTDVGFNFSRTNNSNNMVTESNASIDCTGITGSGTFYYYVPMGTVIASRDWNGSQSKTYTLLYEFSGTTPNSATYVMPTQTGRCYTVEGNLGRFAQTERLAGPYTLWPAMFNSFVLISKDSEAPYYRTLENFQVTSNQAITNATIQTDIDMPGSFFNVGKYIKVTLGDGFHSAANYSLNYLTAVVTNAEATAVITLGYPNLVAWCVDQVDTHLPIVQTARASVNLNGTNTTETVGSSLIKEAYIPFFYNTIDMGTMSYRMVLSLLNVLKVGGSYTPAKPNTRNKRKGNPKGKDRPKDTGTTGKDGQDK